MDILDDMGVSKLSANVFFCATPLTALQDMGGSDAELFKMMCYNDTTPQHSPALLSVQHLVLPSVPFDSHSKCLLE